MGKDFGDLLSKAEGIEKHRGRVGESAASLLRVLRHMEEVYRIVGNLYAYANMKLDEDTKINSSQALFDKALGAYVMVQEKTSFITPEILKIDEKVLEEFYKEEEDLKLYKHYLDNMFRKKNMFSQRIWKIFWLKWERLQVLQKTSTAC